jgi:hypothetical protein
MRIDANAMGYEATARTGTRKTGPCTTCALPCLGNMALEVAKMGT